MERQGLSNTLNSIQLMFLIHTVPIGVGILGLVRFVADRAGHDAPLAILLSGVYTQAAVLFSWLLLRRFQTLGIYDIHRRLFGKWIGSVFSLLFAVYCLFAYFMTIRTFVELVNTWMFPLTPVWLLTLLFMIPIVYSAYCGIRLLGRYAISAFFLTAWIILLAYFPLSTGTLSHLFPIGSVGLNDLFQGSLLSALSLLGVELLLVYYPYVAYKKDVLPAASIASWSTILVYTVIAVVTIIFFSIGQLGKTIWPMLTMFKHVQVPFIERFETIIIAVWLVQVVNTSGTYLWAGIEGVRKAIPLKKGIVYSLIAAATLPLSQMINGRAEMNLLLNLLSKSGFFLMIGYPLLLWLISLILRRKGDAS